MSADAVFDLRVCLLVFYGLETAAVQSDTPPMSPSRTRVHPLAERLVSVPRAHLRLDLSQDRTGVSLSHADGPILDCPLTPQGMVTAGFVAQALGAKLPPLGESRPVRVSTGVLFRAVSIAELDFSVEESYILLERLLDEAAMQRGGSSDAV